METGEKLLLFGGLPTDYLTEWEITSDLSLAAKKLGLRFEAVPTDELRSRYTSLSSQDQGEAVRLAQDLIERASQTTQVADEEIAKAARLYLAMARIVEERGGDGVTIVCSPWIRTEELPVPCVALTLFQERGIPAACQGDLDALLTMVLFKRAAGVPTFMGGAVKANRYLGISHCVLPRNLCATENEGQAYYLSDYHGRKESPTVHAAVPVGEVATVARFTPGLRRLLLTSGTIKGCQDSKDRCRNTLVIDVPDRERVFDAVKGVQNHYVVACGDHRAAMEERAGERCIEVVAL
jgi:L-fucose isomerase-like protein